MVKISVVIPCYNLGKYLDEAVQSVLDQSCGDFEVIIVDDGSTDAFTVAMLENYSKPHTRVIRTGNAGVSAARNRGISEARGKYILPLDADDLIGREYLALAAEILDGDDNIGIVYCLADFMGKKSGRFALPDYSLDQMLLNNVIFCSGFFRKTDWETVGGYKSNMTKGLEDWDFWLSLLALKREVHRIDKVLFFYRIIAGSRTKQMSLQEEIAMHTQMYLNHQSLYSDNIGAIFQELYQIKHSKAYRIARGLVSPGKIIKRLAGT